MTTNHASLIAKPDSTPDFEAFVGTFDFEIKTRGRRLKYVESYADGIGVNIVDGLVEAIAYYSDEDLDFSGYRGPLPMGLQFSMTRDDVRRVVGPPDRTMESRLPDRSYGHAGVDRYDRGTHAVAVIYSVATGLVSSVTLEDRRMFLDPPR